MTITIQSYSSGLSGVRAANPAVRLSVGADPELPNEPVLVVEYPVSTGKPAERDVWCDAENHDWSAGRAISFRAKSDEPIRLSVSFMDAKRVAYTAWINLEQRWQPVELRFSEIKPNPFFQLPGADTSAPLDVTAVKQLGFAPQVKHAGRFCVSGFIIV